MFFKSIFVAAIATVTIAAPVADIGERAVTSSATSSVKAAATSAVSTAKCTHTFNSDNAAFTVGQTSPGTQYTLSGTFRNCNGQKFGISYHDSQNTVYCNIVSVSTGGSVAGGGQYDYASNIQITTNNPVSYKAICSVAVDKIPQPTYNDGVANAYIQIPSAVDDKTMFTQVVAAYTKCPAGKTAKQVPLAFPGTYNMVCQ